jgi:hypothetical protein
LLVDDGLAGIVPTEQFEAPVARGWKEIRG